MILSDNSSSMASLKPLKKRTKGSRNATVDNEQMRWKWNKNQLTREKNDKIRMAIAAWTIQLIHHLKKDQTKTSSWWNSENSTGTETSNDIKKQKNTDANSNPNLEKFIMDHRNPRINRRPITNLIGQRYVEPSIWNKPTLVKEISNNRMASNPHHLLVILKPIICSLNRLVEVAFGYCW